MHQRPRCAGSKLAARARTEPVAAGQRSVRLEMVGGVVETATMYRPYGEVSAQVGMSGTTNGFTGEQRGRLCSG